MTECKQTCWKQIPTAYCPLILIGAGNCTQVWKAQQYDCSEINLDHLKNWSSAQHQLVRPLKSAHRQDNGIFLKSNQGWKRLWMSNESSRRGSEEFAINHRGNWVARAMNRGGSAEVVRSSWQWCDLTVNKLLPNMCGDRQNPCGWCLQVLVREGSWWQTLRVYGQNFVFYTVQTS